jgi:flavin reductase (DIM6/NTAB) family NADH-FMN oxidoreductase RutF
MQIYLYRKVQYKISRGDDPIMDKIKLGRDAFLYPMPVSLVGAMVAERPNFLTVAFCGIMNPHPPVIYAALNKAHYTNAGIKERRTFSVNLPSAEMVRITDYCGMVSGREADKSKQFQVFYGDLETAPMIADCPLSMECKLLQVLDFKMDEVFIGEIWQSYSEERFLSDGLPDPRKMDMMAFSLHDNHYWRLGEKLGRAWRIGKTLKDEMD